MAERRNALTEWRAAPSRRKLLLVLLAALAAVLGWSVMHFTFRGGPGAAFDRAVEGDPAFSAVRAMRDRLPDDYLRLRAAMVAQAQAGRPMEEIGRSGFGWMRSFMHAEKPAMARAPAAELAAFRRGQLGATEALAADSAEQCARFSMGSLAPGDPPSAQALPAIQRAAAAQIDAIAAGRRVPSTGATPELPPADLVALIDGMRREGAGEAALARFTGPAGMATASPAEQCEVGLKLLEALNALPAPQADRITRHLITHS